MQKQQPNPQHLRAVAPKRNMTHIPRGFYAECAKVLGAKFDHDGNLQVLREELSQDEIARRYRDELAKRHGIQVDPDYKSPEELLTEGYELVHFHYDWLPYDDEELEEQADGGRGWSFRLPSFLHRKSRVAKPTEPEAPLAAPKRTPQPKPVAKPKAPKAVVVPPQNPVTGGPSHPTTAIHYNTRLKVYSGSLHSKNFPPMSEKRFFSHLLSAHGFSSSHAEQFIQNVRSGSTTGFEKPSVQNHLDHAHRFLGHAIDAHRAGNYKVRDQHMEYVHKHLDQGYEAFEKHMKRNPNELSLGANHPVFHQIAKINGMLHHLNDFDDHPSTTRRR